MDRREHNVKRQITMATRKELTDAVGARYRMASRAQRTAILNEYVALTGQHRKHAIRVLGSAPEPPVPREPRSRLYDVAVRQALILLWEASDRLCGKRLKALIPALVDSMERHGHLDLDEVVRAKVLRVSAATIDRALGEERSHIDGKRKRRTGVGAAIRRSVPVRTFSDWHNPPPGFLEVDMVEHCGGPKTDGNFVHTLVLTDIDSGWTECIAMPVRNQHLIIQAMDIVADVLPVPMLGIDTDNDSAFMNQTVFDYCKDHKLDQTRSRAYKKNDQAWVEQKKRGHRQTTSRIWTSERSRRYECIGGAVRHLQVVRKLFPAFVQVEIQDTRWRACEQKVPPCGDPMRPTARIRAGE